MAANPEILARSIRVLIQHEIRTAINVFVENAQGAASHARDAEEAYQILLNELSKEKDETE